MYEWLGSLYRVGSSFFLDLLFPRSKRAAHIAALTLADVPLSPQIVRKHEREIMTLFDYKDSVARDLIQTAKFEDSRAAQTLLARAVQDFLTEEYADQTFFGHPIDAVIPIPLSKLRLHERGYNQVTRVLAQALTGTELPAIREDVFTRTKHTKPQTELTREERFLNMHNAFSIAPEKTEELAGKHVLLVDDVVTTGATLAEAAKTLEKAGISVSLLAFARA